MNMLKNTNKSHHRMPPQAKGVSYRRQSRYITAKVRRIFWSWSHFDGNSTPNFEVLDVHSKKTPLCRLLTFPTFSFRLSKIWYSIVGQQQHLKHGKSMLFWQQFPSRVKRRSSFSPLISICASAQEQLFPAKHQHPTLRIPNTRPPELVTTTQFSMQGMYSRQHLDEGYIYLQFLVATATSCPNNLSLASKGRLQTQTALDRQSEVSLMYPFLLATLKLGSASERAYSLAASQKQQKILSRQSCSWSIRQYLPYNLPEPVLDSLNSLRLFCSAITLLKIKLKLIQKPEERKQAGKQGEELGK